MWQPELGVVARQDYCGACRKARRKIAKRKLSLRPISLKDLDGPYLLPRVARGRQRLKNVK
jgi:hypothetical protein